MFVTFYSYKGGVGRSLALANIACLLAEDSDHPQKVLLWDFDLEAPGLHKLFPPKNPQPYGFVDLVYQYASCGQVPKVTDYIYESNVRGVDVLQAGTVSDEYCDKLQSINWPCLFPDAGDSKGPLFGPLLDAIRKLQYDYVLIDSRTGLSDHAGICTQVLAELIIVLFRLTDQNLDGLEYLIPAVSSQLRARGKTSVGILPIASALASTSSDSSHKRRDRALAVFGAETLNYIRFDSELITEEKLFCQRHVLRTHWPTPPITNDYRLICDLIRKRNEADSKTIERLLSLKLEEGDYAFATSKLPDLLRKRPLLPQLWSIFGQLTSMGMITPETSNRLVNEVLAVDELNPGACLWKARFAISNIRITELHAAPVNEAEACVRKSLEAHPDEIELHRLMANLASSRGDLEQVLAELRRMSAHSKDNAQILVDLANTHIRMGANYFGAAADELEQLPSFVHRKYARLAYIRSFLGEQSRAEQALKDTGLAREDAQTVDLVKAHALLIAGLPAEADNIAQPAIRACASDSSMLANWAEFMICREDFPLAIKVATSARAIHIVVLAEYLKNPGGKSNDVLDAWAKSNYTSWDFTELLVFRERVNKRKSHTYEDRLSVLEELIRQQALAQFTGRISHVRFRSRTTRPRKRRTRKQTPST
jgi:MinD-like ATPase involved in chromosome partitioning or flagellar assembly